VVIRRRAEPLHLVHPKGHDHYAVLRAKLHWARELLRATTAMRARDARS